MRFFLLIFFGYLLSFGSCKSARERNLEYMPDMGDSRSYEAQASTLEYKVDGINFNARPVAGTMRRGAFLPNGVEEGAEAKAKLLENPLNPWQEAHQLEGKRLYGIHCAPCHGVNLDGNGPLYNGGDGPFAARPATLLPLASDETDGSVFYTISFGKNMMGAFRDRLSERERWLIVGYIRQLNTHKNN